MKKLCKKLYMEIKIKFESGKNILKDFCFVINFRLEFLFNGGLDKV